MDNKTKLKMACMRISFLMPHQKVNQDLYLDAANLLPANFDLSKIDRDSADYAAGAMEALVCLLKFLEGKGEDF